jgi:hypothetical protein
MQAAAHRIGFHPNSDQVITLKAVQSLFPADSHTLILRFLQEKNLCEGMCVFTGGFAIFTVFLDGTTWLDCGETCGERGEENATFCGL